MSDTEIKVKKIDIFDTTLRDGEQSPGATMNSEEKLEIAKQLAELNVDVIEAGFPVSSQGDFDSVYEISEKVQGPTICALARALEKDIEAAAKALEPAAKKRIHTFIATSPIHMEYKLKMQPDQVLAKAQEMVKYARSLVDEVEFSAEDACRSEKDFLYQIIETAIDAGASIINIPDTVGYTTPEEFGALIKSIKENVKNIDKAKISVHCHNDLGLAVANSLAAIKNGAEQVECTINGIGERAGNASLEEIVMILKTRKEFSYYTDITTQQIIRSSRLVSNITGMFVQPNKAIVGSNAFAHESGIHQDGMLKNKHTYEIVDLSEIGLKTTQLPLGPRSGKHALKSRLEQLGFKNLDKDLLQKTYERFIRLADKKKRVDDRDLVSLATDLSLKIKDSAVTFELLHVQVTSGTSGLPTASICLRDQRDKTNILKGASLGTGPVDAACKCIRELTKANCTLTEFSVKSVTEGIDSLGEVTIRVQDGDTGQLFTGHAAKTDILVASATAYVNAVNKYFAKKGDIKFNPQTESELKAEV
ncbi:MAG: 2-isopropylmalate synthase [Candidatus Caenarcaniphilales bacterium]|nr:2-isopropylmalate synthase [Candidatus Caenarcaniphilales bacterium]